MFHSGGAQTIFLRQAQKHIEDLENPLVSESAANKFNKKWKLFIGLIAFSRIHRKKLLEEFGLVRKTFTKFLNTS